MINSISLPRLAFVITTRCNLKCKFCSVGVPTQKVAYHMSFAEFNQGLISAFALIDTVDSLEFGGGEPFLHADLPLMIETFSQYKDQFNQWLLITNGTILLSDNLKSALINHKDKGVIHISDYGIDPQRLNELCRQLEEIGFKYRVLKYHGDDQYQGGWVDPGDIVSRNRTTDELQGVFSNCGLVQNGGCWRVYKGKIHYCARSCRVLDEGYDFPNDYVDLFNDMSIDEKGDRLRSIINTPYIMACDYCNGDLGTKDKSKRISAGEQIKVS